MKLRAFASTASAAVICACMALTTFAPTANAQDKSTDSHLQAAIAVVEQTNTLPDYQAQLNLIALNSKNWLIRENPTAEKDIVAEVDKIAEAYKTERSQMVEAVAEAWSRYLKEDELNEVLAFFKTPAGQKFANYQPRIIGESIGGIQEFSAALTGIIVKTAKVELNKKGYKFVD